MALGVILAQMQSVIVIIYFDGNIVIRRKKGINGNFDPFILNLVSNRDLSRSNSHSETGPQFFSLIFKRNLPYKSKKSTPRNADLRSVLGDIYCTCRWIGQLTSYHLLHRKSFVYFIIFVRGFQSGISVVGVLRLGMFGRGFSK